MPLRELTKKLSYYREVFNQTDEISQKDKEYKEYLKSLDKILEKANEIYDLDSGHITAASYKELSAMYNQLSQQAFNYINTHRKDASSSEMSKHVINMAEFNQQIGKVFSDNSFRPSAPLKIDLTDSKKLNKIMHRSRVKVPVITPDGRKGFFIPKTEAGLNREWERIITDIKKDCPENLHGNLDALLRDFNRRQEILSNIKELPTDENLTDLAVKLGIAPDKDEALKLIEVSPQVKTVLTDLVNKSSALSQDIEFSKATKLNSRTRIDNRRAAMYDVARFLGCEDVVETALPMEVTFGDEKISGTFIEVPEMQNNIDRNEKIDVEGSSKQADLYRQFSDMKIVDYICGYSGRRNNNISCKLDSGKPPKIVGIHSSENSSSFTSVPVEGKDYPSLSSIKAIDIKTAKKLQKLDHKTLEEILKAHKLSKEEIEAACKRAALLQQQMINNFNNMYIIDNGWGDYLLKKDAEKDSEDMQGIFDGLNISAGFDEALSSISSFNLSKHIKRENEIVVADKKISKITSVLDSMSNVLDDGEHFGRMKESLNKLQIISKEIIEMLGSDAPDKKEKVDHKQYDYEHELNIFKIHTAEYLMKQREEFSLCHDEKKIDEIQKKIEFAGKLQENVQQIQDDMVEAFNAEMQAEVMRIMEAAKKDELAKQSEPQPPEQQKQPEPQEIKVPELHDPELGDRFALHRK